MPRPTFFAADKCGKRLCSWKSIESGRSAEEMLGRRLVDLYPTATGQRFAKAIARTIRTGEGHELTRSGLPSHRVARFEAVLDWWQRHLKPAG